VLGNLNHKLKMGLSWTLISNGLIGGTNLIAQIWLARELGVKVIGDYATIVVGLELILLPVNFGFNQAVIKFNQDPLIHAGCLTLVTGQALATIGLSSCAWLLLSFFDSMEPMGILLPGVLLVVARILNNYSTLFYAPLESGLAYTYLAWVRIAALALSTSTAIALAVSGGGVYALVVRDFLSSLVILLMVLRRTRPPLTLTNNKGAIGRILKYCLGVWLLNVLERAALRIDYAMVGTTLGRDSLGVYYQIRALIEGCTGFLVAPVQTVGFSFYNQVEEKTEIIRKTIQTRRTYLLTAALGAGVTLLISKPLVGALLGEKWIEGHVLLPSLVLYGMAILWYENIKVISMAIERQFATARARVVQIGILILLYPVLLPKGGMAMAGVVTAGASIALAVIATTTFRRGGKYSYA